jgi:hypothetical protein
VRTVSWSGSCAGKNPPETLTKAAAMVLRLCDHPDRTADTSHRTLNDAEDRSRKGCYLAF